MVDYIYHLRHATSDNKISVIPIEDHAARAESTINRMLCAVLSFYKFYYLQHGLLIELGDKGVFEQHRSSLAPKGFLSFASASHPHSLKRAQRLIKSNAQTKKIPKTLTDIQQKQILSLCKNRRDQLLVLLLLETGMRVGQALQLKHQDIMEAKSIPNLELINLKPGLFSTDIWDLSELGFKVDEMASSQKTLCFSTIHPQWLRELLKETIWKKRIL